MQYPSNSYLLASMAAQCVQEDAQRASVAGSIVVGIGRCKLGERDEAPRVLRKRGRLMSLGNRDHGGRASRQTQAGAKRVYPRAWCVARWVVLEKGRAPS